MDSYNEFLKKIYTLPLAKERGCSLLNIEKLCEIYNNPQNSFPIIHVAGTNGKGSVCTKIASCLGKAGYVTGLYTSPHISSFRERIQIGGHLISEEELTSLYKDFPHATFFETATLLAFLYFQKKQVDVAVIETGIGGRWDATNISLPIISVITSIGYDHTDILGSSLESIALEKAGIIKKNTPVVIGPGVPYSVIKKVAAEKKAPLYQSAISSIDYDIENQGIARCTLDILSSQFSIPSCALQEGLLTKPSCRFEHVIKEKKIIIDVAHNAHGFAKLLQMLDATYPQYKYRFIVGFSKGKDITECALLIQEKADYIHLVSSPHPRLASIQEIIKAFSLKPAIFQENSIEEAIHNALKIKHSPEEIIIITGSFFIMSDARKALGIDEPKDPLETYTN